MANKLKNAMKHNKNKENTKYHTTVKLHKNVMLNTALKNEL